ncbi:peptidoglycan D,D-transpeptidase FtsI family protein [Alicyclobacillus tolerans]|uniref:peptidoglycan D,D-transpeptidase FtsI family protein n=1 Tax=Alicyclobacillus tolerans TaxID=90970 RepID=UPI003B824B4F
MAKKRSTKTRRKMPASRLWFISGMTTLAFTSLILRMGYLQVVQGATYRTDASNVAVVSTPVLPPRGYIYSSNGTILARDQYIYDAYLARVPHVHQDYRKMAELLAPIFHTTVQKLLQKMNTSPLSPQVRIAQNLSYTAISYISEHHHQLPGIEIQTDYVRQYPLGDLAGHILGYVGPITPQNESYYVNKLHYLNNQTVGETGIEAEYNKYLEGKAGYEQYLIHSNGSVKSLGLLPPPQSGDNIQLTINSAYQAEAQKIVSDFIQRDDVMRYEINSASAVVLNVKTGAVLALVSYPFYNPNWFVDGNLMKHEKYLNQTSALIDNAIQSPEYPGSSVKPANALAGLETGTITPNTIVDDKGYLKIGNRIFHNWYLPGFGPVNVILALEHSDDTFFYQLAMWFGGWTNQHYPNHESYTQWVKTRFVKAMDTIFGWEYKFGLGQLTGIDLPGEVKGQFYEEDTKKNYEEVPYPLLKAEASMKKYGYFNNWGALPDLAFADIGQSQEFTPIEMAQYVMTLADKGVKYRPYILKAIYPANEVPGAPGSKPIYTMHPKVQARIQLNPKDLHAVYQGMYLMANAPGGLLYQGGFAGSPYHAAGKTGTAQIVLNGKRVDDSVTIAFAPFHHPQIAIAVMVPGGGASTTTASHIAHRLFNAYFEMHHEYFPQSQWLSDHFQATAWLHSFAYKQPEEGVLP